MEQQEYHCLAESTTPNTKTQQFEGIRHAERCSLGAQERRFSTHGKGGTRYVCILEDYLV